MVDRQRILERAKTALGLACLAATLLLTSSGVTIVRADETAKPSQQAATPAVEGLANETLPTPKAARAKGPAAQDPSRPIVLNTRGYNYGPNRPLAAPKLSAPAATGEQAE